MKKFFVFFAIFSIIPQLSYSIDTAVKGFIALDVFNYKHIDRTKDAIDLGIGVLDLKIFAEQDNMLAAFKLDLDGDLASRNNIFEEAYASYRGIKNLKISLGKGIVKFQNLHWGVIANTYQDGGSVIESDNSWRKISRKALLSFAYGNKPLGFTNYFTIWGDSSEVQFDEKGNPKFISTGTGTQASPKLTTSFETKSVVAFTTQKQLGLANKFEFYTENDWTLMTGQVYYKNKLQEKASYALDFGLLKDGTVWEFWLDAVYGFTSKSPFEPYATYKKNEYFLQAGAQYHINELWSALTNFEYLHVKDQAHTLSTTPFTYDGINYYSPDSKLDKKGQTVVSSTYKLELGALYKLSKSSFITNGVLYEKKIAKRNGVPALTLIPGMYNPNATAFEYLSSISFWF